MEPAARQACASWRAAQEIPGWQGSASLLGGPEQPPGWPPHSGGRFCSSLASAWAVVLTGVDGPHSHGAPPIAGTEVAWPPAPPFLALEMPLRVPLSVLARHRLGPGPRSSHGRVKGAGSAPPGPQGAAHRARPVLTRAQRPHVPSRRGPLGQTVAPDPLTPRATAERPGKGWERPFGTCWLCPQVKPPDPVGRG